MACDMQKLGNAQGSAGVETGHIDANIIIIDDREATVFLLYFDTPDPVLRCFKPLCSPSIRRPRLLQSFLAH